MKTKKNLLIICISMLSDIGCQVSATTMDPTDQITKAAYCSSSGGGSHEYIANVRVADLNNASSNPMAYTDFTHKTARLITGENPITLTPGFVGQSYTEYFAVYIDFNQDGDFSDAGENVMTGNGRSAINGTINVPSNLSGSTRMRVSMKYNQSVNNACENIASGEVEDYTVSFNGTTPPPPPNKDMPDMCATGDPSTATTLSDGVPICVQGTSQFTSFRNEN